MVFCLLWVTLPLPNLIPPEEIVNFPVDHQYLREVTDRVELARDIDTLTHQFEKKKHKNEWFQQAAKEMDLELEEDQVYPL